VETSSERFTALCPPFKRSQRGRSFRREEKTASNEAPLKSRFARAVVSVTRSHQVRTKLTWTSYRRAASSEKTSPTMVSRQSDAQGGPLEINERGSSSFSPETQLLMSEIASARRGITPSLSRQKARGTRERGRIISGGAYRDAPRTRIRGARSACRENISKEGK